MYQKRKKVIRKKSYREKSRNFHVIIPHLPLPSLKLCISAVCFISVVFGFFRVATLVKWICVCIYTYVGIMGTVSREHRKAIKKGENVLLLLYMNLLVSLIFPISVCFRDEPSFGRWLCFTIYLNIFSFIV